MASQYPDFYIVGAPKCGTTSLYEYLSAHPSAYVSPIKEPHFFAKDFPSQRRVQDAETYLKLFSGAPEEAVTGEASVWYLYSRDAVREIMKVRPDAKFIVILRNPIEVVRSLHAQQMAGFVENISDFQEAWRAQEDRARGRNIPLHCSEPEQLLYGKICKFSEQIERLFKIVPKSQILVLLYERFFSEPVTEFQKVLHFLGLPFDGRTKFERVNANQWPSHLAIHRFISQPPRLIRPAIVLLRELSRRHGLRLGIFSRYVVGMRVAERPNISESIEDELRDYFAADIKKLEAVLGESLDVWRDGKGDRRKTTIGVDKVMS